MAAIRARNPWGTIFSAVAGVAALALVAVRTLAPEGQMFWLTLALVMVSVVVFGTCLIFAIRDRRRAAEADRQAEELARAKAARKGTKVCPKCSMRVPRWFIRKVKDFWSGRVVQAICLRCESDDIEPYPEPGETEDEYVEQFKLRHEEWRDMETSVKALQMALILLSTKKDES